MRGVVPINSQLLVLISAPASDERSGASRRPNYDVPRCPGPRPATNQSNVSCHPLHLRRGGAYITSSAYTVRAGIISTLGVFLHFEDPLPLGSL